MVIWKDTSIKKRSLAFNIFSLIYSYTFLSSQLCGRRAHGRLGQHDSDVARELQHVPPDRRRRHEGGVGGHHAPYSLLPEEPRSYSRPSEVGVSR